jgi:threonine synthase
MKPQYYISTRGDKQLRKSAQAIIMGLAADKGLFVPVEFPQFGKELPELAYFAGLSYAAVAESIIKGFFTDFTGEELARCVENAYNDKNFDSPDIAPVRKTEKAYFLELYHGRTSAFKDMALSIHPYLIKTAVSKEGEDKTLVILTATSGDTGKAALAGFADVPGTEIFVFYPGRGVSEIQRRQMITQEGANVHVFGIDGNFDDAQTAVKNVFNDSAFSAKAAEKNMRFTSANSISIGRLIPQIAYYVYGYAKLLEDGEIKAGEEINICVPTGNFGNILAAYYAKTLGLPVAKLICASNENNVLSDFLRTGVYDAKHRPVADTDRDFIVTTSPSMDILISSNLERLLYHLSGNDASEARRMMSALDIEGRYDAGDTVREGLRENGFVGGFADMEKTHSALAGLWEKEKYLIDTHTAVAYAVYLDYLETTGDGTSTLIASTASPYKFAKSIAGVLGLPETENEFEYIDEIAGYTGTSVPAPLADIESKPVLHGDVIARSEVAKIIAAELGLRER